jgi:hypothetical protein
VGFEKALVEFVCILLAAKRLEVRSFIFLDAFHFGDELKRERWMRLRNLLAKNRNGMKIYFRLVS